MAKELHPSGDEDDSRKDEEDDRWTTDDDDEDSRWDSGNLLITPFACMSIDMGGWMSCTWSSVCSVSGES